MKKRVNYRLNPNALDWTVGMHLATLIIILSIKSKTNERHATSYARCRV
ncbi:hypothetical protein VCHA47P369_30067 [Vibrio chagasii]|nr:hypothetical protein VCHA48P435_10461 [Vibrio chagasii]CAH7098820.1 hypothetical protein VCHA51O448_10517 [Vibrio chagasii]CAH7133289.1 hypothetical protein VCHA47P369_30067 [Vibrio chagasii]